VVEERDYMSSGSSALFFLGSHNEVDQISPILYKLGERGNISVEVKLENSITSGDYRIEKIKQYDNITIFGGKNNSAPSSIKNKIIEFGKEIAGSVPTNIPEKIYGYYEQSSGHKHKFIDDLGEDYGVIAFDWSRAKKQHTEKFADSERTVTIVLPHGDSPFVNRLKNQKWFDRFLNESHYFENRTELDEISYENYKKFQKYDYILFPNNLTASRMPKNTSKNQIKIFGSPRYNDEWLQIISDIRPNIELSNEDKLKIVFFLRREGYFVAKDEVLNTLELLNHFSNISVMAKEHPRDRLLNPTAADGMENVEIVKDEISSASLIEWGDIFLSLGTTITFEPIIRKKPVLEIDYAHANYTVVSDYFSEADIRSFDELYDVIYDLLQNGTKNFYDEHSYEAFVQDMVSPKYDSGLDSWAEFIENQAKLAD